MELVAAVRAEASPVGDPSRWGPECPSAPEVCSPLSDLSYQGPIHAHPGTAARHVAGLPAGLRAVTMEHTENTTNSPEEAAAVVDVIGELVGRTWLDGTHTRPGRPAWAPGG